MHPSLLSDFDEIVFLLLRQPVPVPVDDLTGIVQHYLTEPAPRPAQTDLLLVALARPEFDDTLLEDVRAARPDAALPLRGARLAGLAARPVADHRALLRAERSLKARLVAAELSLSARLLAELVVDAPPKLLVAAMQNQHRPEEVDLAAVDHLEHPRGHLSHRLDRMLRRTPAVEQRVRCSENFMLRHVAWAWCDTPADRLAFAVGEIKRPLASGDASRFMHDVLWSDEAADLAADLLRRLESLLDAQLTERAAEDDFHTMWWRTRQQKTLDQVRRLLTAKADDPHPSVAVLLDRVQHADHGEATEQAEQRLLVEARSLLGHGADFWRALARSFDVQANVPDLTALALLIAGRPTAEFSSSSQEPQPANVACAAVPSESAA